MVKVALINHTPNPEATIIHATRTCYNSFKNQNKTADKELLRHIVLNDETPLEFVDYIFFIEGISRACSHQLVRHRIASYAQRSQRYVKENDFEYVIPASIEKNFNAIDTYRKTMLTLKAKYEELINLGIKKEDARYLLPNSCCTTITAKFNARSLRHFLKLRLNKKAQWEIRNLAKQMKTLVTKVSPILMEGL